MGAYWQRTRERIEEETGKTSSGIAPEARGEVTLTEFDPEGESRWWRLILYAASDLPDDQLLAGSRSDVGRGGAPSPRR